MSRTLFTRKDTYDALYLIDEDVRVSAYYRCHGCGLQPGFLHRRDVLRPVAAGAQLIGIYRCDCGHEHKEVWSIIPTDALCTTECIRHGSFGPIVWDIQTGETRMATQDDLDTLPVGEDLTADEEASIEEG